MSSRSSPDRSAIWQPYFAVASATHVGMRRRNNQDNHGVFLADDESSWGKYGHMLIVADGMGAHAAGELASQLSVELIPHYYRKLIRGSWPEALQQSLIETNSEIYRRGQANPEFRSMGTTTCALTIVPEGAYIAHVGDSRVYRLRGSSIEQLTFDHSLVWEMRASGELSEEALKNSTIPKNVITRSLGPNASVLIDIEGPFPVKKGDKFLMCSDGLSGQLRDEEMGVLMQVLDRDTAVQAMIDLANLRGGPDNITVVIGEALGDFTTASGDTTTSSMKAIDSYPVPFAIATVIGVLLSLLLLILGHFPIALISLAAAAAAFATGWLKFRTPTSGMEAPIGNHGKSPYRRIPCKADAVFTENLAHVMMELEAWFEENKWPLSSDSLTARRNKAKQAELVGRYSEAIREYVHVIMQMMREARRHQAMTASDSESEGDPESISY